MKRMILVLLIIFIGLHSHSIYAQLSDEHKNIIQKDIKNEIVKQSKITQMQDWNSQYANEKIISFAISSAIRNNQIDIALQYFDYYTSILDTLVISNPIVAKQIIIDLQKRFVKVTSVNDRLEFYTGAANYYLQLFDEAESNLISVIKNYPRSSLLSNTLTLLIKTYIYSSQESKAVKLVSANKDILNMEQKYLAGHVYFAVNNDSLSAFFFNQVMGGKYGGDAEKMLGLLAAINLEPPSNIEKLNTLLKAEPENPFILLSLARMSSIAGQWENAGKYYSKYIPAMKNYRELQIQYELALLYLNLGDKNKAIDILDKSINNKELGSYLSPLLSLWAQIVSNDGKANEASSRVSSIKQQLSENERIVQSKVDLIKDIDVLKARLGKNTNVAIINKTIEDLTAISRNLDSLNSQLNHLPYGLSLTNFSNDQIYERQMIISLSDLLHFYIVAENMKDAPDTVYTKQLASLENIYQGQIERIQKIQESLIKLNDQNLLLAIRNEIDDNIEILNKTLENLKAMKDTGKTKYSSEQLDTLIVRNERQRIETTLLKDYYDIDNTIYRQILAECDSSIMASREMLKQTPAIKAEYQKRYPAYISNKEKKEILNNIDKQEFINPDYISSIQSQVTHIKQMTKEFEFIDLNISFIETVYYDKIKKQNENIVTFEENQRQFNLNQERKQKVYNQIYSYINAYTETVNERIPFGYPEYSVKADAYFALAELSNSLWQDKPAIALSNYRKVLEIEPKFYLTDAVLYNIGYLSSVIVKNRIENGIINFENKFPSSTVKPDSLRFTEKTYSESIYAYSLLIDNFKGSQYYSESIFRLGFLYFEIGTNADRPVEYYQIARSYYDKLVDKPGDSYHYKALYQRGWTWLNSGTEEAYNKSMDDFVSILKSVNEKTITDSTEAIDYSVASIKNIGFSLVGLDGSDINAASKGAEYAKQSLSKVVNKKDLNLIIDEAIQRKLKLYMPMQAIDFMNAKIELDPLALENPIIADSICTIYKLYPSQIRSESSVDSINFTEKGKMPPQSDNNSKRFSVNKNKDMLALENPIIADSVFTMHKTYPSKTTNEKSPDDVYFAEKGKLTTQYGLNSEWYKANKNKDISKQIKVIKQAYDNLESHINNQFVDTPNIENFKNYTDLIDQYVAFDSLHDEHYNKWFEEKQANIIALNLKLAQVTKNPIDYLSAANRIYAYNDKYPENSSYFNLEGAAYDCARIVNDSIKVDLNAAKLADPTFTLPLSADSLSTYFDLAAQRFAQVLLSERFRSPQNDRLYITVVMKQAEISRDKKRYAQASEYYQKIISFTGVVSNEIKRSVLINLAEIADLTKNYAEAEKWYRMAEDFGVNNADKELLHQNALLQIQNSIDNAKENKDNGLAGEEYLRLAQEYSTKDPNKSLQYKAKAQGEYLAANEYQKSIDLLIEMSKSLKKPSEVLEFYRFAWSIADSLGNISQADSIKQQFVDLYPSSNEAYQLRLSFIDKKAANTETMKQAGDMYMSLYGDVINKKIDSGKGDPVDLFLAAIGMYDQAGDEENKKKLSEQFINKYPNSSSSIRLMEYLADNQLAKGDSTGYEQMAKTLFQKDKNSQSRYVNIAKDKLRKIASEFNKAYLNKDWTLAFKSRDEFKKVHAAYEKEGMQLDFTPVYEVFKQAEIEYNTLQERLAFLKQYDSQLSAIDRGFIARSPDELLKVNVNTKWKTNMSGVKENRIQALKNNANAEAKKVKQILEAGVKYDLDVDHRLRAFDTIGRIYNHGADVIRTQVDTYMNITSEFKEIKQQLQGQEDELYSEFNNRKEGPAIEMLQQAYPYYIATYKYFYIPGYHNKYTNAAKQWLEELKVLPRYRIENIPLDKNWQLSTVDLEDSSKVSVYKNKIDTISNAEGMRFYQLTIPANSSIVMKKTMEMNVPCDYQFANVITPYYNDSIFMLNNEAVDFSFKPIDTLKAGDVSTTRYALTFGEGKFIAGKNDIILQFVNYDTTPLLLGFNLMAISDSTKIEAAMPIDTLRINTNNSWSYSLNTLNPYGNDWKKSSLSQSFGLEKTQWYEMETSPAEPIWVSQSDSKDSLAVVFQKEFNFEGILKEGMIKFIAPDIATIKINDIEISTDYLLNYDSEANLVFAGQIELTKDMLKQGNNRIQIIVQNSSQMKGVVVEMYVTAAHPE